MAESWVDFAKNEHKLGNADKVKYYTAYGLKDHSMSVEPKEIYSIIDNYISIYPTRKEGIKSLVLANYQSAGADYIAYLNCSEVVASANKEACFRTLYEKYPNGQFSADSLYNIFISKYLIMLIIVKKVSIRRMPLWFLSARRNCRCAPNVRRREW